MKRASCLVVLTAIGIFGLLILLTGRSSAQNIDYLTQLKNKPQISFKDKPFNAKGDGTTNDTVAVQAAITYAVAHNAALNCQRQENYKLVGQLNVLGSVSIVGACTFTQTTIGTAATPIWTFNLTGASNVIFYGVNISGPSISATDGIGGTLTDTAIRVSDATSPGLVVKAATIHGFNIGINDNGSNNVYSYDNVFYNIVGSTTFTTGDAVLVSNNATNGIVSRNHFFGGSTITSTTAIMRHGTYCSSGCSNFQVTDSDFHYILISGINSYFSTTNPSAFNCMQNYRVTGNTLDHTPAVDWVYAGAIDINGCYTNPVISNNTISDSSGQGISASGMDATYDTAGIANINGLIVSNNSLSNIKYTGLFQAGAKYSKWFGNTVRNAGMTSGDCIRMQDQNIGSAGHIVNANIGSDFSTNTCVGNTTVNQYAMSDNGELNGAAWNAGTTYAAPNTGATYLAVGTDGKTYSSIAGGNLNHNPVTDTLHIYWNDAMVYIHNNILFAGSNGVLSNGYNRFISWSNYPDASTILYTPTFNSGVKSNRVICTGTTAATTAAIAISGGWGATAVKSAIDTPYDSCGSFSILAQGGGYGANPTITYTFVDGNWPQVPHISVNRLDGSLPVGVTYNVSTPGVVTGFTLTFNGTPQAGQAYSFWYEVH